MREYIIADNQDISKAEIPEKTTVVTQAEMVDKTPVATQAEIPEKTTVEYLISFLIGGESAR